MRKQRGPLHRCDFCVVWSIGRGFLAMGIDIGAGASIVSLAPIPQLDCLAQSEYRGRCLVLWQLDRSCFAGIQRRSVPF